MRYEPVTTLARLTALDTDVMVTGYRAGLSNKPNYTQKDPAYWHGYMNGQVDGKHMPISSEQCELAGVVVASWKAH